MGQSVTTAMPQRCESCKEDFFWLCHPGSSPQEQVQKLEQQQRTEFWNQPAPEVAVQPALHGAAQTPPSSNGASNGYVQDQYSNTMTPREYDQGQSAFFIPPPPADLDERSPLPRVASNAPVAPAPRAAAAPEPAQAVRGPAPAVRVDLEFALADLEGTESSVYNAAFDQLASGARDVEPDNIQLRAFVLKNTCVAETDLETVLLTIASASESFSIDCAGFLSLLRENAITDGEAIEQFMGLTNDGEHVASEDCRSGLIKVVEQVLNAKFSEERSEMVLDAVMCDAGLSVSMEEWVKYCKKVARVVRLMRYAGTSSRSRGGA